MTGELDLTQGFGPLDNGTYLTRGYSMTPSGVPFFSNPSQVRHHIRSRALTAECMLQAGLCSIYVFNQTVHLQITAASQTSKGVAAERLAQP